MPSGPNAEQPSMPTLRAYRYHAEVVGYRDHDGGPRHLMVDIEAGGETAASLTPDEAAVLSVRLMAASMQARAEQAYEPERRNGPEGAG